jgi:hypothetical protein
MELMRAVWRYSHIGFLMGVLCVGGFFLGRWIDSLIWKAPVFSIVLFMIGFALGFYRFILLLQEEKYRDR